MWEDIVYTKAQAKYKFQQIAAQPENCAPRSVKPYFENLRAALLQEKARIVQPDKKAGYEYDLQLGLVLYEVLHAQYAFNERIAARDEIWRYLALEILPDFIYERYGISDDRYYKRSSRVWPKAIWWYIHLSWQGTAEQTYAILKDNSSDEMMQLVDRSGTGGFRLDLTRELMRQHYLAQNKPGQVLRRILKLNTARLNIVEPGLVEGGVEAYVSDLYHYFNLETLVNS